MRMAPVVLLKEWDEKLEASICRSYGRESDLDERREMQTCGQEYNPIQAIPERWLEKQD